MAEGTERESGRGPLPVGVIGLGRCWQRRYEPALRALRQEITVVAVSDPLLARAEREARRLGCQAAGGVVELLEHPQVAAVLLLAPAWYGLWPLEMACQLRKPVFCGFLPWEEEQPLEQLHEQVASCGLFVMAPLAASFLPTLVRLRHLLQEQLGALRWLLATGSTRQPASSAFTGQSRPPASLLRLLDAADWLLARTPQRLLAASCAPRLATVLLDYGQDLEAQLTLVEKPAPAGWRLEVAGANGWACAEPGRLAWSCSQGCFVQTFARQRPLPERLLHAFCQAVRTGQTPRPTLSDACRLLNQWRCCIRSQAEGKWLSCAAETAARR
jgi:predicted dehydrogenase